ncbi:MAG: TonB-dependent receptor, partial [Candidatus Binatia bacterium]
MVTAQKTEQSLQDVPLSVSALSGEFIREAGLTSLVDIVQYTPNVQFYESSSLFASFNIRGFATPPLGIGLEPSVGLVIDDVPYGRSTYAQDAVFDLDRLEVLRGPQGALFGKNTVAGVLSFTTAEPSFEPQGTATLGLASLDDHRLEGGLSFPLIADVLATRLSFRAHEQEMGVFNTTRGETNDIEDLAGRLKLLWLARHDLEVGVDFWASHLGALGTTAQLERATSRSLEVFREFDPRTETDEFDGRAQIDEKTSSGRTAYAVALKPVWSIGDLGSVSDLKLALIGAWSQISTPYVVDPDFSPIVLGRLGSDGPNLYQQASVELRVSGSTPPPLGWGTGFEFVAGLYGEKVDSTIRQLFDVDLNGAPAYLAAGSESEPSDAENVFPVPPGTLEALDELFGSSSAPLPEVLAGPVGGLSTLEPLPPEIATEHILSQTVRRLVGGAAFFQGTWSLAPRWDLTLGSRLGFDLQEADLFSRDEGLGIGAALAEQEDFEAHLDLSEVDFSPKIALSHHWTDEITFFATVARGFKAGGFAMAPLNPDNNDYDAEKATSFELGGKSTLLGGAMMLNVTGFWSLLEDLQVRNFTGVTFTTENADRATSRGFELDLQWLPPLPGLNVAGSLGFIDARFDRFPNGTATAMQRDQDVQDLSGRPLPYTPGLSASLYPSIGLPLLPAYGVGALFGVDFLYRDGRFLDSDLDPLTFQDATPKVNLRLGFLR